MAVKVNAETPKYIVEMITVETPKIKEFYTSVGEELKWRSDSLVSKDHCPKGDGNPREAVIYFVRF